MRTIQEVIKNLDPKQIEKYYFSVNPVDIFRIHGDFSDVSVNLYRDAISSRFREFLDRLKNMKIEPEEDQGILVAYKTLSCEIGTDVEVDLVYRDELLKEDCLTHVSSYAYEFTPQEKALGFLVADNKYTQDNIMDVVVDFLCEVSFFGYEQEDLEAEKVNLDKAVAKVGSGSFSSVSLDEMKTKLGLPIEEVYPREEEFQHQMWSIQMEFNRYCRNIELQRLKESL